MLFVVRCLDKAGHLPVRMENRPAHVEFLKSLGEKLFAAGGILNEKEEMCGSIVIFDVADKTEVEAIAANDPYAKAGLFASVTIDRWNKVLP